MDTNKRIMHELILLYRELFYGRQDIFAVRWENEKLVHVELVRMAMRQNVKMNGIERFAESRKK